MIFLFHKWIYVKFLKLYWHIVFNKYRRNSFFNRYIECLLCGRHCSEKVESIIFFSVTNMSVSLTAHFPALGIIIFLNLASLMMKMIQFIFINNKSKTFLLCDDSWIRYNPFFYLLRILIWRIPWTEEPGRLQSMGSRRVWHDWVCTHTFCICHYFLHFASLNPSTFPLTDFIFHLRLFGWTVTPSLIKYPLNASR